jgi:hypothetical protein
MYFFQNMDSNLFEFPVPPQTQALIATRLWSSSPTSGQYQSFNTPPFFRYYSDECRAVFYAFSGRVPIKTHEQLMLIIDDVLADLPRSVVKQNMALRTFGMTSPGQATDDSVLEAFMHLSIRILAMLNLGQFPNTRPSRHKLEWPSGTHQNLTQFIAQTFPRDGTVPYNGIKLGPQFTAQNLDLIAGLKVELTTNLADHLLLREDEGAVLLFHHASFLKNQQRSVVYVISNPNDD